jgi:hypothetical protein
VPAATPKDDAALPILGRYRVEAGALQFQPRFPLERGLVYRARFDASKLPGAVGSAASVPVVVHEFTLPRQASSPTTRVAAVYPTRNTLPENLLKFYLEFSAPMSHGAAYGHIHLRDATGRDLDLPFLEVAEELWDPRGQRLTILFDPGRIKTGLKPREELGPVLRAGESYTLVIDRGWLDAAGEPLIADHRKTFRVGPADSAPPDPADWKLGLPTAGTRDPLVLTFPEPLDRAMLGRVVSVLNADKKPVSGDDTVDGEETRWRFAPERPWVAGRYFVAVSKDLEDLAGNSIGRPFEVDVFDKIDQKPVAETATIPFRVEAR